MVLKRWSPFTDPRRLEYAMNRLWQNGGVRSTGDSSWHMPLDVTQNNDHIVVKATVPGFKLENIRAEIENRVLTIQAEQAEASPENEEETEYLLRERRSGPYYRSIRLPDTIDADGAESTYNNGVLSIIVPKQEAKKARQITIKTS